MNKILLPDCSSQRTMGALSRRTIALAIGFWLLAILLFGCAAKEAEKPAPTPKIEEKDITAIEEESDPYFTDDLDQGVSDLEELENVS